MPSIGGSYYGGKIGGVPQGGPGPISPGAPQPPQPTQGGGPAPQNSQVTTPPAPQYTPGPQYSPNTYHDPNLDTVSQWGEDMMDPDSDYFKQLMDGMRQQIGMSSQAGQRAQVLRNVWGGGSGGGELSETQGDIGRAGLNAQGQAGANLRLQAPSLGVGAIQSTFNPRQNEFSRDEQSQQYGHGSAQQDRQYKGGLDTQQWQTGGDWAHQQQQNAQQNAQIQAQLDMQKYLAELNAYSGGLF